MFLMPPAILSQGFTFCIDRSFRACMHVFYKKYFGRTLFRSVDSNKTPKDNGH